MLGPSLLACIMILGSVVEKEVLVPMVVSSFDVNCQWNRDPRRASGQLIWGFGGFGPSGRVAEWPADVWLGARVCR